MKLFLYKLILFLLPLALLILFMEKGLAGIPNSYSYKKSNLEKQLSEIELLIVGASHAYFGVDPAPFSYKSYNMANASQSLYYDAAIIKKYLPELKRLKVVVFTISYFSFGCQLADTPENWRCYYYERYYGIPNDEKKRTDFLNLRSYSLMALYGGKESYNYLRKGFKINFADNIQPNGWYASAMSLGPINAEAGRKRVQIYHDSIRMSNCALNFRRIDDLFALLRQKGIEPVIITPPVYHTCYDYLDPTWLEKTDGLIHSLCDKFNVRYFNYLRDKRFIKDDFTDNDHLNPLGAEKFSRILNADIMKARGQVSNDTAISR